MTALNYDVLVEVEDVKSSLGLESGDNDNLIRRFVNSVSADCQKYCKRLFLKQTSEYEEKRDGDGTAIIFTLQRPIISISSIVPYKDATALDTEGTHFDFNPVTGEIRLLTSLFYKSFRQVVITYHAGYDGIGNLPSDLVDSVVEGIIFKFNQRDQGRVGMMKHNVGDQSSEFAPGNYPQGVIDIWNRYRKKTVR